MQKNPTSAGRGIYFGSSDRVWYHETNLKEGDYLDLWLTNIRMETSYIKENGWTSGSQTKRAAIGISEEKITEILPMDEWKDTPGITVIDGQGQLLLPGLIEKHCHLDKSKLGTPWRPVTPAANLVERFETEIPQLEALPLSIKERAQQLIDLELPHGVVSFRSPY